MGRSPRPPRATHGRGAALDPRPRQVDDYSLGSCIGVGLTGTTFLATRSGPDGHLRQLALKLCHAERAAVMAWAPLLMEDIDPRVVRYEAVGPREARWSGYWVTDVIRAEPLERVIEGAPIERRLRAMVEVAEALATLHRERIVHGHLLPQNVLMRREGSGLAPLVTDVGVRLRLLPEHDAPDQAPRLFPYLAPEAVVALAAGDDDAIEPPADVYSLGALLCALLTGTGPGTSLGERTRDQILRSKARWTYSIFALLDADELVDLERVTDLLQRSLSPRPVERPSAGEFAQALRAALLHPESALP